MRHGPWAGFALAVAALLEGGRICQTAYRWVAFCMRLAACGSALISARSRPERLVSPSKHLSDRFRLVILHVIPSQAALSPPIAQVGGSAGFEAVVGGRPLGALRSRPQGMLCVDCAADDACVPRSLAMITCATMWQRCHAVACEKASARRSNGGPLGMLVVWHVRVRLANLAACRIVGPAQADPQAMKQLG